MSRGSKFRKAPVTRRLWGAILNTLEALGDYMCDGYGGAVEQQVRPRGPTGLLCNLPPLPTKPEPAPQAQNLEDPAKCSHDFPIGCLCATKGGPESCSAVNRHFLEKLPIGANLPRSFFSGSPQEHAILNRHLLDYFNGRQRAQESTPYNVPASQRHLLPALGMEQPQPDAPETPHALHKSIEEFQLRRLRNYLPANQYGIISVKASKLHLLPTAASVQNPVFEAKDSSRYPGTAIRHATLANHPVHFMHDVSSVVTPHELVEKLVAENPEGHLFVTGVNPAEALDRATTFEPSSHMLEYDLGNFNFIFTDSESESYMTPIDVTLAWLRTSSVAASNGRVYHVVMLEYKLGHCLWHIFCGDAAEQDTRTFSTGSFVQVPPAISGTLQSEYLPVKLLSGILDFVRRTPDLSTRNLSAKVAQIANAINPRTTSRERWIATHVAGQLAPNKSWDWYARKLFWNTLYLLSFQWQMLRPLPDIYAYLDERKRSRTIHPTPSGGWSPKVKSLQRRAAIPNRPTMLQRVSAFTCSVFTFLLPKILIGEFASEVVLKVNFFTLIHHIVTWTDMQPARLLLTAAIVAVTSILPGHVVKVFSRLSGHFWRQLWLPGWISWAFERIVTELGGGPGSLVLNHLPGRGWFWQAYLWAIGLYTILPGLVPCFVIPWMAWGTGSIALLAAWYGLIILENLVPLLPLAEPALAVPTYTPITYHHAFGTWLEFAFRSELHAHPVGLLESIRRSAQPWVHFTWHYFKHLTLLFLSWLYWAQGNLGNCHRVPNLPALPRRSPPAVRRRNVDIVLPTVTVLPAAIPGAPAGVQLAVDPVGLNYPDWLQQVTDAYNQNPRQYPQLTPGQSCFWDSVAHYGGTAHMWYSWFMAFNRRTPDPNDPVVGNVTLPDIQIFAATSRFGLNITGLVREVTANQGQDWPTLHLNLSRSVVNGQLHIELAAATQPSDDVGNLAKLIRTIREISPAWDAFIQQMHNNAPVDSVPRPSPFLLGVAGANAVPDNMTAVADAILASFTTLPITDFANQGGFAFDNNLVYVHPFPPLYNYEAPVGTQPIGREAPLKIWQKFSSLSRKLRLKLSPNYQHPANTPDMKIGATASQSRDNRVRGNVRPDPPLWVSMQNELANQLKSYRHLALPAVPLQEETIHYTCNVDRAARLAADLKAHPSVLESHGDRTVLQSLDAIIDTYRLEGKTVTIPVKCYFGVWGCGKTTATRTFLHSLSPDERSQTRIVSHTESLRAATKVKLDFPEMRGYNFPTIASILTEASAGPIVLDDAGKYWGGLIDLICLCNPTVPYLVVNGDPAQGLSCTPIRGGQSEHDPTAVECVASSATMYATITHRGFRLLSDTLGVHTTNPVLGHITHTSSPKVGIPVCTASPRYVGVLQGAGRKAYTYESVQGEDFSEDMEIDMTGLEGAVLDRTAYVALTRSKSGVYLHLDAADPNSKIRAAPTGSDLMNALIYAMRSSNTPALPGPDWVVKAAFYRHLHWCMPLLPWFATIGASIPASAFQTVYPKADTAVVVERAVHEHKVPDEVPSSSAAFDEIPREVHHIAKEYREVGTKYGQTDQFKETSFVNPHVHKRGDTPTYFLSVEKRLTTATKKENALRMQTCPRTDLCDEYDKLVPNPPKWTAEKHCEYVDIAVDEYCAKRTEKAILTKLAQHDPDRTGSDIKISLKNQVIKKDEKRNKREAIPGQLIHEYDILQTLGDAPFALFLENEIIPAFPKNFLFYRRMNPSEFKEEYKKRWRVGNGVHTSDVTRWDVGCDAGVLNFDIHIMQRSGFPQQYIDDYRDRRLSSRSQHGPMQTMQNSGDRFTWPINSTRRAVLASKVLQVEPEDTVAINGDDEAMDRCADALPFPDSPWEFKDQNGLLGEFSGFELGGEEPVYSARGIHYRCMILESRDPSAQDKWVNYLDLLSHADLESDEAADVARSAQRHMDPYLFMVYLPKPLQPLFPEVFF